MNRSTQLSRSLIALTSALLMACTSTSTSDSYRQKLQWLDDAIPQTDAHQAVQQNDLRLLGLATRGLTIPGVSEADTARYEKACGVLLIDGISDVVRNDEHLRLMQKARRYALEYNAIIKQHCQF